MKSASLATLYLWSNSAPLSVAVEKYLENLSLKVETKEKKETDYRVLLISLNQHENLNTLVLDALDSLKDYAGKTCLVIAGNSQTDQQLPTQIPSLIDGHLKNKLLNFRVILTFDLYDVASDQLLSDLQEWLCQAARAKKVTVSSSGKNLYYPTSISDLCHLITKSLFVTNTSGEFFTAAGEVITDLEIAYLIKKSLEKKDLTLDPDLKGKTSTNEDDINDLSIQTQALLNWQPKVALADQMDQLVDNCLARFIQTEEILSEPVSALAVEKSIPTLHRLEPTKPVKNVSPGRFRLMVNNLKERLPRKKIVEEDLHQTEKRGLYKLLRLATSAVILLALIPFLTTAAALYAGTNATYQAYQHIRIGEEEKSRRLLNRAQGFTGLAQSSYQTIAPALSLVSPRQVEDTGNFISILGSGQAVLESVLDAYTLGNQLYQGLLGKQEVDHQAITAALRVNLVGLSEKLSQIQLLIGKIELPFGYGEKLKAGDLNQQINLLKSQINLSLPLLNLVAAITNNKELQRYLFIIQDQNELRPSGGFITSYGIVTLDQGKIVGWQVGSSLTLDRLIEGRIEPPSILKNLLGQTNWLFHDSNLDADFAHSANQVAWFYERFKSTKLDGVIGLNLNFLNFILDEIGALSLPDGQTVAPDNLNQLASNPTAGRGVDVVTAITQALSDKFLSGEIKFAALARSFLKTITYNETNLWFRDPRFISLGKEARLAGEIKPFDCHPQLSAFTCRPDTIYLNEANFSVSKINFYLKRKQIYLVEIKDGGEVDYTLTYDYSYPVPAPTNLSQTYKAYYQFYLPLGSPDLQITLDGKSLAAATLIQTPVAPLTKVEFSAAQAINQSHQLVIKFTSPFKLDLTKPQTAYALSYLKQPGTLNDQLVFRVIHPESLQPRTMTVPLKQVSATELVFEVSPTSSENLGLLFKNTSM